MAEDYYKLLGVERNASAEEITKAYRNLARKHHPDLNPDDKLAKSRFQEIQSAYDCLNDPAKRQKYDQFGANYEQMGGGVPRLREPAAGSPSILATYSAVPEASILVAFSVNLAVADDLDARRVEPMLRPKSPFRCER
ncbi:MAG: DnaJ domain-containing protein [Pirellula sp.]